MKNIIKGLIKWLKTPSPGTQSIGPGAGSCDKIECPNCGNRFYRHENITGPR